ncbi:hypothetical protein [Streptomyces fagopyri]
MTTKDSGGEPDWSTRTGLALTYAPSGVPDAQKPRLRRPVEEQGPRQ